MSHIRTPQIPPRDKRVCVEFLGGEVDGLTVDSWSEDPVERQIVELVWVLTRGGTTNRGIEGVPFSTTIEQYTGRRNRESQGNDGRLSRYRVKERLDEGHEILIRLECQNRRLDEQAEPPSSEA